MAQDASKDEQQPDTPIQTEAVIGEPNTLATQMDAIRTKMQKNFEAAVFDVVELSWQPETLTAGKQLLSELYYHALEKGWSCGTLGSVGAKFSSEDHLDAATTALERRLNEECGKNYYYSYDTSAGRFRNERRLVENLKMYESENHRTRLVACLKKNFPHVLLTTPSRDDEHDHHDLYDYKELIWRLKGSIPKAEIADYSAQAIASLMTEIRESETRQAGWGYRDDGYASGMDLARILKLKKKVPVVPESLRRQATELFPLISGSSDAFAFGTEFGVDPDLMRREAASRIKKLLLELNPENGAFSELRWIGEKFAPYAVPVTEIESDLLASLDRMVEAGMHDVIPLYFTAFSLDKAVLSQPPRREKVKEMLQHVITMAYQTSERRTEVEENDRVGAKEIRLDSWYALGYVDVFNEVLCERAEEAMKSTEGASAPVLWNQTIECFTSHIALPKTFAPRPQLQQLAQAYLLSSLRAGNTYRKDLCIQCGADMARPEVRTASIAGVASLLKEIDQYREYDKEGAAMKNLRTFIQDCGLPEDILRQPELKPDATDGFIACVCAGKKKRAEELREACMLGDVFKTPEGKAKALTGISKLFQDRKPERAMDLCREVKVTDAELANALQGLMKGEDPQCVISALPLLPDKALQRLEQEHCVRSYKADMNIPSVRVYREYVRLKNADDEVSLRGFIHRIQKQRDALISSEPQDATIVKQPYYRDLVEATFPNNADNWTTFESNESCRDRSKVLEKFTVRPNYSFTLAPGMDMQLKEGARADEAALARLQEPIVAIQGRCQSVDFDPDRMKKLLDEDLAKASGALKPPDAFKTREEKLFCLLLEHAVGRRSLEELKPFLILYQFAEFEDIRQYLEGTQGRADKAKNPQYAYLLELREFFADRIKDASRRLCDLAMANPLLVSRLPDYFRIKSARERERTRQERINKLRIPTLGLAEGFLGQIAKTLQRLTGRAHSVEETRALIREYEDRTNGMADAVPSDASIDRTLYGQIRAQRLKTIQALETIQGTKLNPAEIHLGEIDLAALLEEQSQLESGTYNEELFSAYLAQSIHSVFGDELDVIDAELGKYAPTDSANEGAKRKRVEVFLTMNHTSAHARGTAGVCVSGNNAVVTENDDPPQTSLWDMPNYLQMVLRDGETKVCQGCVLLHLEEENGLTILTASLNPSSTYLYQVNEAEMFESLLAQLITFAEENSIDAVAVSQHPQIRTNRTGGVFEKSMIAAIERVGRQYRFAEPRIFSTRPKYFQQALDVVWAKDPSRFAKRETAAAKEPDEWHVD